MDTPDPPQAPAPGAAESSTPATVKDAGIFHGFVRSGRWRVNEQYRSTVVVGSGVIDLRTAEFTGKQTTIRVRNWVGSVFILVPDDADVRLDGTGVIGGFHDYRKNRRQNPQGPRITVAGAAVSGSVFVVDELPASMRRRVERRNRRKLGKGD
ncbi:LiaF domain-containing protein [Kitasatospora sp. NBC_00315]|uniref:LiaF domain-containing protein n=1 Tax=Kitasatospora sp. NBC_00315 TaxID=2975963 RepID=UPI00324455EE